MSAVCLPSVYGSTPSVSAERKALEKAVRRQPGDMSLRCRLISAWLAESDTAAAERELDYALSMRREPCLLVHKASLALGRGQTAAAAQHCVQAVCEGLMPDEEPLVGRVDSLSGGMVTMRLRLTGRAEKSNSRVLLGLAQLCLMRGDTAEAVANIKEACLRGDSTMYGRLAELALPTDTAWDGYEVFASIPFTRKFGKIMIDGSVNGLKVKIEVDTAATSSSISGVETLFMLKNDYIRSSEIIDDHIVITRDISLGGDVVLHGVRLYHIRKQESPVILSLKDLSSLGVSRVNESGRCIELLKKTDNNQPNLTDK